MPRKSAISRLPAEARTYIEKLLRNDQLTLDEMLADIRARFPAAEPSRSSLHRYQVSLKELTGRMRDIDTVARAVVGELGESPDEKAGALLCQAITTLATHAALSASERDDVSIDEVRKLARAAKDTIAARTLSLKERQAIEQAAREKLQREQAERLDETARAQGMDDAQVRFWREKVLGIQ
ncbi:DUF3486 family protein [Tahibacter soli]|uniref:DUF3486 family protein n=1 Tax=Tahibacter soli TaxID=2983605 RepID=A0A9X3YKK0_9GAMM|nr:DUF3486 family protein [Tahibacter soli]MDC8012925.1 DUF3486 family protein [Tahibacter soli]